MPEVSRNARIQAIYREVNEEIALMSAVWEKPTLEVLCECGIAGCSDRIEMGSAEYESMRSHPTRFALVPGHQDEAVERVVAATGDFLLVENTGRAAEIAERTNPRTHAR